ncbi:MAG: class I SAM-dependent methyltransferase [Bacteroidota bacterium]
MFSKLFEYVRYERTFEQKKISNDTYALQILSKLLADGSYLPITRSSLRPYSLASVVNDIVINGREQIIEFGAGVSTVAIARLFKLNQIQGHLYTVDESKEWLEIISNIIKKEGLDKFITPIHAELVESAMALKGYTWYNIEKLDKAIGSDTKFDLVLVDGPSAYETNIQFSRYPALPFMRSRLGDRFSFYLDDSNRKGEKWILKKWSKEFGIKFIKLNSSLAYAVSGDWFRTYM